MLIRADPATKHDLAALVPARPRRADLLPEGRRRAAATGSTRPTPTAARPGTLDTVKHLTDLPINYLITVNFHGFKEIVDKIGGIWLDVDRRYYNVNNGTRRRRTTPTSTSSPATSC